MPYLKRIGMDKQEMIKRVEKNRELINAFLSKNIPLSVLYFNVRTLSAQNERLLKLINA